MMDALTLDGLMAEGRPSATIQARFEEWLRTKDGEYVYHWIAVRATKMRRMGWKHYGIKAMWEAARFARDVQVGPDADGYKLNNNFTSRLARQLMADYPELAGFFEVRGLRA